MSDPLLPVVNPEIPPIPLSDAPPKAEALEHPAPTEEVLVEALKEVIDPELMVNIVDLGLVYSVMLDERVVQMEMTLTSPSCPAGPQIIHQSKMALERVPGVAKANIRLTMSPPWTPARMTDDARDMLGIF
jgi:metal-sulfur cluster biosynthetic enzyme